VLGLRLAALGLEDADALHDLLPRMVAASEDRAQASDERRHLAVEQAGLQIREQLQRCQQRVDFRCVEPQAGQLVAGTRARPAEAVAVQPAVVLDRRVEAVAHVVEVALERGARDVERLPQSRERDQLAVLQELVDLEEALEAFHRSSPFRALTPASK